MGCDLTSVRMCEIAQHSAFSAARPVQCFETFSPSETLLMTLGCTVIQAEPDGDGVFWCPEPGCDKSFAKRDKSSFLGFRKYQNAYYHYWSERKHNNGHTGFYCKSANSPQTKQRCLAREREGSTRSEQPVISGNDLSSAVSQVACLFLSRAVFLHLPCLCFFDQCIAFHAGAGESTQQEDFSALIPFITPPRSGRDISHIFSTCCCTAS